MAYFERPNAIGELLKPWRAVAFLAATAASVPLAGACNLVIDDSIAQGGVLLARVSPVDGTVVWSGDSKIAVTDDGQFLVGIGRDQIAPVIVVAQCGGDKITKSVSVVPRQFDIQRVEGVPQSRVTPPKSVSERIAREAKLVADARANPTAAEDFLAGFSMPLQGPITGVYGSQRYYNGEPRSPHYGLDVAAPNGTPVGAPAPGRVVLAEPDLYFSGGTVIIDHGHGLYSTLMHLSRVDVSVGERVERNDLVGAVGASGRATGPHLDWRMMLNNDRVDPALVLEQLPFAPPAQ